MLESRSTIEGSASCSGKGIRRKKEVDKSKDHSLPSVSLSVGMKPDSQALGGACSAQTEKESVGNH